MFHCHPKRRDRIHHLVAINFAREEREQDADAKIEAVENDVHRDRKSEDRRTDERQPVGTSRERAHMTGGSARDSRVDSRALASG